MDRHLQHQVHQPHWFRLTAIDLGGFVDLRKRPATTAMPLDGKEMIKLMHTGPIRAGRAPPDHWERKGVVPARPSAGGVCAFVFAEQDQAGFTRWATASQLPTAWPQSTTSGSAP